MNISTERVKGSNRQRTAKKLAEKYFDKPEDTIVAYGWKYADALVGGYLGARKNAPILLTNTSKLDGNTKEYLETKPFNVFVLGGAGVISEEAYGEIELAAIMTENEKEAMKALGEFEGKLEGKDKLVNLVNDDEARQAVSEEHTELFNMIQNVENSEVKTGLLERLDLAHNRLIAATSVKSLLDFTKDGVTKDNLGNAEIKLSNAKTNIKNIKDDPKKDALMDLIKPAEEKIQAQQQEEALEAVNAGLTVEELEDNAEALGLDTTAYTKLKESHDKYGQGRVEAVVKDIEENKEEDYTAESFKKYFNAAVRNRTVYAEAMDYVNGFEGDGKLEVDKFIGNVIAVLKDTKSDLPKQGGENIEDIITQMEAKLTEYNDLSKDDREAVLEAVKNNSDYERYMQILGVFANSVDSK